MRADTFQSMTTMCDIFFLCITTYKYKQIYNKSVRADTYKTHSLHNLKPKNFFYTMFITSAREK